MSLFNLLGDIFPTMTGKYAYLNGIIGFLNQAIMPLTISLVVLGAVFSICLVFAIMKAETAESAENLKSRLKGLLITIIIVTVAFWLFGYILAGLPSIIAAFRGGEAAFQISLAF